ncbi:MAG: mercuric transport protein MerTP [Cyclobacteriaceae bacterium]
MSNSNQTNVSSKSVGAGLLVAITASLCCITPVFATLAGIGGIAATFSWMEPFRPYLIGLTVLVLGFAWYQKFLPAGRHGRPRTQEEIDCACEEDERPSFWQSKKFLGIVTVFAVLMLAFPAYSHIFYPEKNIPVAGKQIQQSPIEFAQFKVEGMTCSGCEAHVTNAVGILEGVREVKASYDDGSALVQYDPEQINESEIVAAINNTGYKVVPDSKKKP